MLDSQLPKINQAKRTRTIDTDQTFESFYKSSLPNMVRIATFILCSQAQAEEVVQDAYIKVHDRWHTINNPGGFLRTAIVNQCNDLIRRRVVKHKHLSLIKRDYNQKTESENVFELYDEGQHLFSLLTKLKPARRTVIVLKYYGGYTLDEIAEILDSPKGTVRSNLRRGLSQLKELMS